MIVEEIRGNMGAERANYENFPVGMRVLAVDDDPICLKLLETLLRKCQYHVTTTSQARIALKMLRENKDRFDLVISDVHMPDMDGFKLLELVGLEMDLPVIMLSANSDTKLVMKGVTHGACDYLVKPVRIEELRNIWQHVLRRKKFDSNNQSKSSDQDKSNQGSGDSGQGTTQAGNADQNSKFNRKRKDEDDENEDNDHEHEDPATQKKPRVVWSIELHRKFVAAVNQLGIEKAVPKRILDLMNVEGLTRENVASHLQKYRLYLKRISSVATQQANMVAALGGKDSPFLRMGSLDGLGDFRSLAGSGRLGNTALSPYATSGMLGRLNSPGGVNLRNFAPSALIQPSHAQNLSSSVNNLGKMHPVFPSNQNGNLLQGIPSALELDQLQKNSMDDSKMLTAAGTFTDHRAAIGSTSNNLSSAPNSSMLLHGNSQQTLSGGGFGSQSSLNMAPFSSESFSVGVSGSTNFLDHGRSDENWQNGIQLSKMQSSSITGTESFHSQFPLNGVRDSNCSAVPQLQNNPLDFSSNTLISAPLEDSRGEMQCQEGLVGDIVQSMNSVTSQRWGEQKQQYIHNSNNTFSSLNSHIPANGNRGLDQNDGILNQKIEVLRSNGSALVPMQNNEIGKFTSDSRVRSNEHYLSEESKLQCGFAQSYDSLDDLVTSMIKRERDGPMADGDFGLEDYSFGQGL